MFILNKRGTYMNCEKCGAKLSDVDNTCPNCKKDSKSIDSRQIEVLRENIVKTAKISSKKTEELTSEKVDKSVLETKGVSSDTKDVSKIMERVFDESSEVKSDSSNSESSSNESSSEIKENRKKSKKKKSKGSKKELVFIRFLFAGVLLAFAISLFFNWFSLSGDAVNIGICRDGHVETFLNDEVKGKKAEDLYGYKGSLISFNPFKMIIYAKSVNDEHLIVADAKGEEKVSFASRLNRYYMFAMIILFASVLFSIVAILVSDKLKYINFIWALSIANAIVIGLNYMAIKVPYFNMFAIKAKSILKSKDALASVKLSLHGISFKNQFFNYELTEEKGFYISLGLLLIWFLMSTVLKEVRYRKVSQEEIKNENL